jgi:hypothetical protein
MDDVSLASEGFLSSIGLLVAVVVAGALGVGLWRAWRAVAGPQPGQVWWAQVPYEEGRGSKDRPVVVLRRRRDFRRHAGRCPAETWSVLRDR